jgi:hypothetical protein
VLAVEGAGGAKRGAPETSSEACRWGCLVTGPAPLTAKNQTQKHGDFAEKKSLH